VVAFEDAQPGVDAARAAAVRVVLVAAAVHPDPPVADGAAARLSSIAGLTPRSLAALLDLAPALT
jgi:beta-phosphoglucomutase-like phosphatase (HAD superfamily)